jgi:hypothetical protein
MKNSMLKNLLVVPMVLTTSCTCRYGDVSGVYIFGKDTNNATYLIIRRDKSYSLIERSSYAAETTVKPFNEVVGNGTWHCVGSSINLFDNKTKAVSESLVLSDTEGFKMMPTLGAGRNSNEFYIPAKQDGIVSEARQKKGFYWETVTILPP